MSSDKVFYIAIAGYKFEFRGKLIILKCTQENTPGNDPNAFDRPPEVKKQKKLIINLQRVKTK